MLIHHAYFFEHGFGCVTQVEMTKGAQIISVGFVSPVTAATALTIRLVTLEADTTKTELRTFAVYNAWFIDTLSRTFPLCDREGFEKWEHLFIAEIKRQPGEKSPWLEQGQQPLRDAFVYELKKKSRGRRPPSPPEDRPKRKPKAEIATSGAGILSDTDIKQALKKGRGRLKKNADTPPSMDSFMSLEKEAARRPKKGEGDA